MRGAQISSIVPPRPSCDSAPSFFRGGRQSTPANWRPEKNAVVTAEFLETPDRSGTEKNHTSKSAHLRALLENDIIILSFNINELDAGGGGGIRTHGGLSPTPVFKTGALNHSATPPARETYSAAALPTSAHANALYEFAR